MAHFKSEWGMFCNICFYKRKKPKGGGIYLQHYIGGPLHVHTSVYDLKSICGRVPGKGKKAKRFILAQSWIGEQ